MLYRYKCTVVKVRTVEKCRCSTWRPIAELMYVCTNIWHEMQMKYPLRAPSALTPWKGPSKPTGQETKYIVEGVLIGAIVHPHVSNWSNFIVGVSKI